VGQLDTRHYGEIVDYLEPGELLGDSLPPHFERAWRSSSAETFAHVE
jgi:hypothetical protein